MQVIRHSDGTSLTLNENDKIGEGGEARILLVPGRPDVVAKVYKIPSTAQQQKLAAMLDNPPVAIDSTGHPSIAWPSDTLVFSDAHGVRRLIGFLMPRVQGMEPILEFCNPKSRRQKFPLLDYRYLHRMARNLAAAVHSLHARGYVIGDINESNILADHRALVTLVDTDSFQVRDHAASIVHRCSVGKPEFTPPELQGVSFRDVDREPAHDLFGLAVIIFQLLMEGTHPFAGRYTGQGEAPTLDQRIKAGYFPYGSRPNLVLPGRHAPPFDLLSPILQQLFLRCFEEGQSDLNRRPPAREWQQALQVAENELGVCPANRLHYFEHHLTVCPWCDREQQYSAALPPKTVVAKQALPPTPPPVVAAPTIVVTVPTSPNTATATITSAVGPVAPNSVGTNPKYPMWQWLVSAAVVMAAVYFLYGGSPSQYLTTPASTASIPAASMPSTQPTSEAPTAPAPDATKDSDSTPSTNLFSPPGGGFMINFPTPPTSSVYTQDTEVGPILHHRFVSNQHYDESSPDVYLVDYYNYPVHGKSVTPDKLLKLALTNAAADIDAADIDNPQTEQRQQITINGKLGLALNFYNVNDITICHVHVYAVGTRIYEVYVLDGQIATRAAISQFFGHGSDTESSQDPEENALARRLRGDNTYRDDTRVTVTRGYGEGIKAALANPRAQDAAFLNSFNILP